MPLNPTPTLFPLRRCVAACALALLAMPAFAQELSDLDPGEDPATVEPANPKTGGKLLLTAGVTQVEGAAGGGLTPWATIGGYGERGQIGANAFYTRVDVDDYGLESYGAMVGFHDRVELSVSRQVFDTQDVGAALGLGQGFEISQDTLGVKVKLFGDAILEQDRWLPQVALGVQRKRNDRGALVRAIGAKDDSGTDVYLSATKLYLDKSLLLNATVRFTEANQFGILGFGGDRNDGRSAQFEGSVAYLLDRRFAIGAEYRTKPDNLNIADEDDAWDVFAAWTPNRHVSLTVAYVDLGNIVIRDRQRGVYASLQVGF
ncbi:DUF3034 family protein [Lysobacter hankyongensis]|uniref:DUF3034 family protein n=1 Tax=Lysobacter hankyongensis TaxID=1176535 RepID=A0ABP9C0S6_9GAMM